MAKSKKSGSGKKPSVKVQDLTPEEDPKGGYSWGVANTGLKAADGSVLKATSITDGTSNTILTANKLSGKI